METLTKPVRDTDAQAAAPHLTAVVTRVTVSLMVAVVVPAVLFSVTLIGFGITSAVIVALGWTTSAIGWRWATKRPFSWLLMLTVTIMAVRTAFTLATGNTFVYFVQPVFSDVTVAVVFLVSLCTARPIVARLAPDFYPVDDDFASRPAIRRLFWRLTLMWGLVIIAKGTITFWLLQTLPVVDFVVIKNAAIIILTAATIAVTLWMSAIVVRKEQRRATGLG